MPPVASTGRQPRVLITGGCGFLGCHLARRFLADGYEVTLFDRTPLDAADLVHRACYLHGDVRDPNAVRRAVEGQDVVVHAAAALPIRRSRRIIHGVNVVGTRHVLEASLACQVKRLVYISSTAVYGIPRVLPEPEEAPLAPIGLYGQSKVAAERLCLEYARRGLPVNILRPKTVLGPERLGIFELWFEAIRLGRRVFLLGDGRNRYQLLSVSDACDGIVRAATAPVTGEVFNLGAREFGSWREDLTALIRYAGSDAKLTGLPVRPSQLMLALLETLNLSPVAAWHYLTVCRDSYVSTAKAERLLGWRAEQANVQLLAESYAWYVEYRRRAVHRTGKTHRVGWNFRLLDILRRLP